MATTQQVTLYNQAVPGVATASLQCIGTMVTDASGPTSKNAIVVTYQATVGGVVLEMGREDFLAVRALKAMP